MEWTARCWVGGRVLEVELEATRDLLSALAAAGLVLRSACRNGLCGLCKCRLLAGAVDYAGREPHALWSRERAAGFILPCIARPRGDLLLAGLPLAGGPAAGGLI
ncbi:MAG: hypothetical protein KatS3mg124_1057 [Porticoccaceae bacterium]|nr:MAG: hypothetical protein KatS3mg124_1057 [Porticoccaceae bacterium]